MSNATQIGRLGALAVALGIGSALASAPCIATAAPSESSASEGSAASSSGAASSPKSGSAPRSSRVGKRTGTGPRAAASESSPAPTLGRPTVKPAKPQRNSVLQAPAAAVDTNPSASVATTALSAPPAAAKNRTALVSSGRVERAVAPAGSAAAAPGTLSAVVQALTSTVQTLFGAGNGGTLPEGPLLWSLLAFARSEFDRITGVVVSDTLTMSPNLLVNPGAEFGDASGLGNGTVSFPGWSATGNPTVIEYGTLKNSWPTGLSFQMPNLWPAVSYPGTNQAPPDGGDQFFGGGNVTTSAITQTIDLSGASVDIDGGGVTFDLSGYLGGYILDPSYATVEVTFLDHNNTYLANASLSPVTNLNRLGFTGFRQRTTTGDVPEGTRSAVVTVNFHDLNPVILGFTARYNNAYADNLSFTISADLPAPPDPTPPPSIIQPLDHVFLVYMENKGYDSIVGSPNAPYLNSLINAYGFANNYYAITHPSLPNYYAMAGGTDFGKTYNCPDVCIDANSLMEEIDGVGKTWAGYAQSLEPGENPLVASGGYSPDQLPFPAFEYVGGNQAYAEAHILPLTQMATDLQSDATTPDFVWFAADEDNNGEGPVDGISGILHFIAGQLNPAHQYNVPALDAFLQENVPTIIDSPVWNDPTIKSALIVTFDEDNNNITLGIGNEGNHIVTVVIPSPGAVALGGMRDGAFIVTDHLNHFSTLRTIEEALGLPTMTNNDKYATPLNPFWT